MTAMPITAICISAVLVLAACSNEERERQRVTKARAAACKADYEKMQLAVNRLLAVGEKAASARLPSADINKLLFALESPVAPASERIDTVTGECGDAAKTAFDAFKMDFTYALGVEHEADFAARSEADKQKIRDFAMKTLKASRDQFDVAMRALKAAGQ